MKGCIFDLDGVLIDSMGFHIQSWKKALGEYGIRASKRELLLCEGMSFEETIEILARKNNIKLSSKEKEAIHTRKKALLQKSFVFKTYGQVPFILSSLQKHNVKLAVVTGVNKTFANKIIKEHFGGVFDVVITGDDVRRGKPHPESYRKAKTKLRLSAKDILVVENAPLGIESARAAGLKVVGIATTLPKADLKKAQMTVKNHKELFELLKNSVGSKK